MKRRGLSVGVLLLVVGMGLRCPRADTIYFKDGTSIDCLVSDEKKKFTDEQYQDPNFIEIEVFGGYVGFWNRGQVERIEKNDKYVAPADETQALMQKLIRENRMVLPTAMLVEGGLVLPGEMENPISARVTQVKNWAFVNEVGLAQKMALQENREFRAEQVVSTARNSRLKFAVGSIIDGGLGGGTSVRINRLNHAEHVSTYEMEFQLERGQMWIEINRSVLSGGVLEKIKFQANDCSFVADQGLFHFQIVDGERFRLSMLRGASVKVRVKGNPGEAQLEPGKALIVPLQGEKVFTLENASGGLETAWNNWDAWQPVEVAVPVKVVPGEPSSAGLQGELSAFGTGPGTRETTLTADLMTDALPTVMKKYREALDLYKTKNGQYPDPAQGLAALHKAAAGDAGNDPYGVAGLPLEDPWGRPIAYELVEGQIGQETMTIVSVRSYGPNGIDEKGLGDDVQ